MSDQINAAGHVSRSRVVSHLTFVRPIPVLGTNRREDQFRAEDGWVIEVSDFGVTLSRAASQNVPAVDAFFTCGVGYSVPPVVVAVEPVVNPALSPEAVRRAAEGEPELATSTEALLPARRGKR